jgi:predicted CoA-binding protein
MMKDAILAFLDSKKVAIVGASSNKDNFGRSLMVELSRKDYQVIPVNPKYETVEGVACVPTVKELPAEVESVILAVPPKLTDEVVDQCIGTSVKRVWMIGGIGRGAYSKNAQEKCREHNIDVVYGFCPLMFYGDGFHKFHFWLKKTFGKLPPEYLVSGH